MTPLESGASERPAWQLLVVAVPTAEGAKWIRRKSLAGCEPKLTPQDLDAIVEAIKLRRKLLNATAAITFKVGDLVTFNAGRRGVKIGTVAGWRGRNILVTTPGGQWRVAPSMLQKQS